MAIRPDGQGPFTCTRVSCGAQLYVFTYTTKLAIIAQEMKINNKAFALLNEVFQKTKQVYATL
jgi:uncharacterized hydantoinase/oxoprolinase family protein